MTIKEVVVVIILFLLTYILTKTKEKIVLKKAKIKFTKL